MPDQKHDPDPGNAEAGTETVNDPRGRGDLSRRTLLSGAAVLAGGTALAAAGSAVLPGVAAAGGAPSSAPAGTTTAEFVAQIAQNGGHLIAYGYFNTIVGLAPSDLFSGPPSDATARYTAYAEGDLVSRAVNGPVTVLDVVGTLGAFHRDAPGANFSDPSSFRVGATVAQFELTLQDVLTVIAPNTGIPTLAGDMTQVSGGSVFGRPGVRLRLTATGLGTRSDATAPVAVLNIAGNMVAV
jgi:hypothetical protein